MKIIHFCIRYKYILTVGIFLLYLFFGDNNILENREWNGKIKEKEKELERCKITVATKKTPTSSSVTTKEEEEEYFRNRLYLKKENEDVFWIVYKGEK